MRSGLDAWWTTLALALALGCGGAGPSSDAEWPDEEQSCGGTGEPDPEAVCAWPRQACELAALGSMDRGGREGTLWLDARATGALGHEWEAWFTRRGVETLALGRDAIGGLRVLGDCQLGVPMTAVPHVTPGEPPAWTATQLVVTAPGAHVSPPCTGATHFVAVARGAEGVALPLSCPPLTVTSAPSACVGADLDGAAREAWARSLYERAHEAYVNGEYARALDGFLTLRALMPDSAPAQHNLMQTVERVPELSCAFQLATQRAWTELPDDDRVDRPRWSARCIPAPPLLGCLSGFSAAPSPDAC